jgi:ubiquinone/menaquinone biosynthesis C-methylase UbiE
MRAVNYARYCPGYPAGVLDLLRKVCGLMREFGLADVGSETGILSWLFSEHGNRVLRVEPNDQMRQVANRLLSGYGHFASLAATAEAITLPDRSTDFVVAGQAFHWFDAEKTRAAFVRVLRPGGWTVLGRIVRRRKMETLFLEAHERRLLTLGTDYERVEHGRG